MKGVDADRTLCHREPPHSEEKAKRSGDVEKVLQEGEEAAARCVDAKRTRRRSRVQLNVGDRRTRYDDGEAGKMSALTTSLDQSQAAMKSNKSV